MSQLDAASIIQTIANSKKQTPVKVTISGHDLRTLVVPTGIEAFFEEHTGTLFGSWPVVNDFLAAHQVVIDHVHVETTAVNSAVPLLDARTVDARIEPGAIIRDQVVIGDHAVIMMGALINIGAEIGADSMIDMGAVLGGRAIVGQHCHIGAGAVLAGVIEPASAEPVRIDDDVLVGANAVVIEGVHVGAHAVVGAGAVVTEDVPANAVVAGVPAKIIKQKDAQTQAKTKLQDSLRNL